MKKILVFLIFLSGSLGIANSLVAQNCNIKITSHKNGEAVGARGMVKGIAQLSEGQHLWVVAHKIGFYGWWPQGNGATQIKNNTWEVYIHYGVKGEYGKFEVLALVVDEAGNEVFEKWVREAPNKNYPPIPLPPSVSACPMQRLIVERVREE